MQWRGGRHLLTAGLSAGAERHGARHRRAALCLLPPRPEVWRRGGGASPGPPRPALGVGGRPMAGAPRTAGDPDGGAGRQGGGAGAEL